MTPHSFMRSRWYWGAWTLLSLFMATQDLVAWDSLLIAGGIVAVAYQGITYTTREKVVDVGDIHVMADKTKSIPLSPVLVLMLVGSVPRWPHSRDWGYGPSGGFGLVLLVLIILLLMGRI